MSWGLDLDNRRNTIIARAESVDYKKTYSEAFVRRRCLVPADGYYEFPLNHDNEKQPVRVVFKDNRIFSFAGIYQVYKQPDGSKISTFAIITTEPNELLKSVHDRMPVILRKEDEDLWLDRAAKPVQLKRLLVPYSAADEMNLYPVSKRVGNVRNDDPSLIGEM
jgi:putative SOS response-associated peptidase YedK